jgi:type I restriction enzyme R subunit
MKFLEYTEDQLVEQPTIRLFEELGWEYKNCFDEFKTGKSDLGRETMSQVVLDTRLMPVLRKLNPDLSDDILALAVEELSKDRSSMSIVSANKEIYKLLKDGVKVILTAGEDGEERIEKVRVIDWDNPENNDYFLTSQFWITGEMYKRRADLIGFVNGLPLVFIELKAVHKNLKNAYDDNLTDYKTAIPQIFWHNAFIVLSNGSQARIGSVSSEWEHFADWKKINSEGEQGRVSVETLVRGTCQKQRLLDLIENFILFNGETVKIIAKYHQYFGVNNAISALTQIKQNQGKLGVFWHTQGSGKSFSMVFFAQKSLRKLPGDYTFVVVTDRIELDKQIYKNFADVEAVKTQEVHAGSGAELRELLKADHRYIFTTIFKFNSQEKISDRSDIIVMADEAHRSQYDVFALNMRMALPNAAFIGFTGTPLMAGEEKTKEVFGDYVSIYNFRQSVEDGATVPLYYENRIPELELVNKDLGQELDHLIEQADLDEYEEGRLEREFSREYHLITRDDRLEKIAEDIVKHYMERGQLDKAMVISIDKAAAVRMYDKVKKYWDIYLRSLKDTFSTDPEIQESINKKIKFMEETDMVVIVSQSQNEIEEMKKKGLDIIPHRRRMVSEDLEKKFKDKKDPLRLVFVCAMWITGFDVPSCSTIYLDKPMKNHTLMQTIARANRVFPNKTNGLIVDYIGIFRDLQKALAIYGSEYDGRLDEGDMPIKSKAELIEDLKKAIQETRAYCEDVGFNLDDIIETSDFSRIELIDQAVDMLLSSDEVKKKYLTLSNNVSKIYRSILPDPLAGKYTVEVTPIYVINQKIKSIFGPTDISEVLGQVEDLLDKSVLAEGYTIPAIGEPIDLSKIDFDALKANFDKSKKRIELEKLKASIKAELEKMVRANKTRNDLVKKFQDLIDEYNAGSKNLDELFKQLVLFTQELKEEEKRGIKENLSEEELSIFDLLTKPNPKLSKDEEIRVKKGAKRLLEALKTSGLVLDWRKKAQARAIVFETIEDVLNDELPEAYTKDVFQQKCALVYQHVYDSYYGEGKSVYASLSL